MADTATIASAILVPVEIPIRIKFFSLIFVLIHTNEFIKLLYKLCSTNSYTVWFLYQFIQFVYELYSTYSYKVWCRECAGRAARGEARAHLLPRPGRTRLPRYTNLYSTIRIIIRSSEKWDCTNSFVWHNGQPLKKNRLFGTRIFGFLKNVRNSSLSTYYWPIQLCSHFFFLLKDELFLSWRLQYIKQTSSWDASNGSGIVLWNTEYFA